MLLAAIVACLCMSVLGSAQAFNLMPIPAWCTGACVGSGPNPHWWIGGSTVMPEVLDRTNGARYVGIERNVDLNLAARSTKIDFHGCYNSVTGWPNTCSTPAECTLTAFNAGTCPGAIDGVIAVYDGDYGASGWSGLSSVYNTWYSVNGVAVPKSLHTTRALTLLNLFGSYTNHPLNTACHELGHAMGLNHRYDYPTVSSCINDTVSPPANTCKEVTSCDYLANDDVNGLDGTLYTHTDDAGTKPPGMVYSRPVGPLVEAEAALEKYGDHVPKALAKRLHLVRHIGHSVDASEAFSVFSTPSLDRLVLSVQGL